MNARQFLRNHRSDERLATGSFFDAGVLGVRPGDHVGVVLMGLGGPHHRQEIENFLYKRWMDPVVYPRPPKPGRHHLTAIATRFSGGYFWRDYEEVGGDCPSNRLVREQATTLEAALMARLATSTGARYSTFVSARYGTPSIELTFQKMAESGVTKAILIPTHPQYSIATTGTSLAYWRAVMATESRTPVQMSAVTEYAVHPLYLQALSDRIDQALQRFPKRTRQEVDVLFCAEHAEVHGNMSNRDSFCDLAQSTVERLIQLRGERRYNELVCFRSGVRTGRSDEESMRQTLKRLVTRGSGSVLIVPLGLSTDHVWTAYTLDILLRHVAIDIGFRRYEVASGLNCHPLYISALAEIVETQLQGDETRVDRSADRERPSAPSRESGRSSDCPTCRGPMRARDWGSSSRRRAASR